MAPVNSVLTNHLAPRRLGAMLSLFQQKANFPQRHAYAKDEALVNAA